MTTRAQRRAHLQNLTQLSPSQVSNKSFWDHVEKANNPEKGITYKRLHQFMQECKSQTSQYEEPIIEYVEGAPFTIIHEKNSRFKPIYVIGDFTMPYNSIKAAQALEKVVTIAYGPAKDYHAEEERKDIHRARAIFNEGQHDIVRRHDGDRRLGAKRVRKGDGRPYQYV